MTSNVPFCRFMRAVMIIALVAMTCLALPPEARTQQLSIEGAITAALEKNPDIRMARTLTLKAEAAVKKAEAAFLPTLTAFSEVMAGDAPSAFLFKTIDQRDLPQTIDFNDPGSFTNVEIGLMAGLSLYNGGRNRLGKQMAEIGVAEKKELFTQTANATVAEVIRMYFSVLKAREYITIAETSVATVREQLDLMTVRFKGGGVLKSDILSLEVRLAEARKALVESRNSHAVALTALATLIGLEPDAVLELDPDCTCPVNLPETYEAAIAVALDTRPELKRADRQVEMARLAVDMANSGYRPRVSLSARWYVDSDNLSYDASDDNYTAALTLQWDLFNGFATKAGVSEAAHDLERAMEARHKVWLNVYQDVKQAYLNHENALQRLAVTESSVTMADESLNLIRQRYQGGAEPVTRYLEAELDRNRAGISRAAAFYDSKLAKSDIARAIGILPELWKQETTIQ